MAQCGKCGTSDRVISKTAKYWGNSISWTFYSVLAFGFAAGMSAEPETERGLKIALFVLASVILFIAINLWRKAFAGKTYIKHECKFCNNKWVEGYRRY